MKRLAAAGLLLAFFALAWLWTSPPPGSDPHAELTVDSKPQGAEVWLDGRRYGVTPVTIAPIMPGPHRLRVHSLGHASIEQSIMLHQGDRQFVSIPVGR